VVNLETELETLEILQQEQVKKNTIDYLLWQKNKIYL
jgi:hypothetical protein